MFLTLKDFVVPGKLQLSMIILFSRTSTPLLQRRGGGRERGGRGRGGGRKGEGGEDDNIIMEASTKLIK